MKKLVVIFLLFTLLVGGGWIIHLYSHSQPKVENIGVGYLIDEGNNFMNVGRYEDAKQSFLHALKDEPKNMEALWGLQKTEAKEKYSMSLFKQAIDIMYQQNPKDSHVNLFLGEYYLANDELDKARTHLIQALNLNPKLAEAHVILAMLYYRQGNINSAKSEISLAIDIAPLPRYRNKLAHGYIKQKHLYSAIAEYEKTAEYPLSFLEVAEIYWHLDRLDLALIRQLQAIEWLNDKSVMALPENREPWFFNIEKNQTISLSRIEEKKAFAYLSLAFTLFLLDNIDETERNIQEMRNQTAARQDEVNTVVKSKIDALVLEKYGVTTKANAFKAKYIN